MQKPNPDAQHFLHSDADPLKNTYNNLMDSRRRGREQMSLGHHPSFCTGLKWTSKRRHNMFIQQELMRKTFYSLSLSAMEQMDAKQFATSILITHPQKSESSPILAKGRPSRTLKLDEVKVGIAQ